MPDRVTSGVTQEELISWGGAEVFNQALRLANSGAVTEAKYDDDTLVVSGKIVQNDGWEMPVSFKLMPGGCIESRCPCETNRRYGMVCQHVVAVGLRLVVDEMEIHEAEERELKRQAEAARAAMPPPEEEDFIEVPMKPSFRAVVAGSRASLSVRLFARYGEVEFPARSMQEPRTVYLSDPDDPLVRRTRSLERENLEAKLLYKWGFEEGYPADDKAKSSLMYFLVDPQKVLNFLGAGLPTLRRAGWRVELDGRLAELVDSMTYVVPVVSIRDAPNGDFDVSYSFEAGPRKVPPAEIQAALCRGDNYILTDGKVMLLDGEAIESMHGIFRDSSTTQNGAPAGWFRMSKVYAPYVKSELDGFDAFDVDDSAATEWRKTAAEHRGGSDAKYESVALGKLEPVLRPYQKQGVYWMRFMENSGLSGLLADEMGLGKTLQTLTWLSLPRLAGAEKRSALIVCPTSLVRNWEAEAAKFTPWLKTLVISGADRARDFGRMDEVDIVITSYALLQRDFEDAYLGREFSAVVLDEAQHIKNRQTKNAKAVKALRASARLVLTGTPVENSVADVWSIFDFLMPGYLGDYEAFKLGYEDPIADGGSGADEAAARLKRKLDPFIMRRVKKSVAKDLPDKIVKVSYCPMSDEAQREYVSALALTRRNVKDMVREKGLSKSRFEILAMLMKLRKIASAGKLEAFLEQLESALAGGHKILVFSQFVTMLKTIAGELEKLGIRFCYLDGSTKDRLGECNRFNRTPEIGVFLISLMAGGTGLNLTGADMVIHYDPWWNPAVEDQATDRAHRIGQKKNVYVMKMIASASIEEKVLELQRRKQAVISATLSTSDEAVFEKLTAADLDSLLS